MDKLVENLAYHRFRKEISAIVGKELSCPSEGLNISLRFETLYKQGIISKEDFLFIHTHLMLNDFCESVEEKIGKGVRTGFIFYDRSKKLFYYAAGKNYPPLLKEFLNHREPPVDMDGDTYYKNDICVAPDLEEHKEKEDLFRYKEDSVRFWAYLLESNVLSGFSKRLRGNGTIFGTFECYYPVKNGPTEEDIKYVRERVQPLKEELYHVRNELLDTLHELDESFFRHEK
jgi:hypothetical protein